MKKRVEADLLSIAHRILKLKNKSEVDVLQIEIKKLYDAITILKFYNDNFDQVKATVSEIDLSSKLDIFLDTKISTSENELEIEYSNQHDDLSEVLMDSLDLPENEEKVQPVAIEKNEVSSFEPLFEIEDETIFEPIKISPKEISFEELLGKNYDNADFVKPSELEQERKQLLYEKSVHGLTISLNDRIGFEQQLFAGSSEDFNRVLSQLNTFDTFEEAKDFIDEIVKPDYENWANKDDFAIRFMDLIETKFK